MGLKYTKTYTKIYSTLKKSFNDSLARIYLQGSEHSNKNTHNPKTTFFSLYMSSKSGLGRGGLGEPAFT